MKTKVKGYKFVFYRDAFFATIFSFVLYALLALLVFNTKYLDPIHHSLADFELTDLYFAEKAKKDSALNKEIVLINVGYNSREQIAREIQIIKSFKPLLIGLDVNFERPDTNRKVNKFLKEQIHSPIPVILASQFEYTGSEKNLFPTKLEKSNPFFECSEKEGFGNFLSLRNGVVRYWQPQIQFKGKTIESFALKVMKANNPSLVIPEKWKNGGSEIINYSGDHFIRFDSAEINAANPALKFIQGKIVLMGFMGINSTTKILEDLHHTPLDQKIGKHSNPERYGVEIHAQIINMMLKKPPTLIKEANKILIIFSAFTLTFLNMLLFLYLFVKKHMWFHPISKGIQLISSLLIFIISILLLDYFNFKLEPTYILIGIALSADSLYFIEPLMKLWARKGNRETYFNSNH